MPHFHFTIILALTVSALCLADYHWPSPQYDTLETLLYEGRRGDGSSLAALVQPCRNRTDTGASIGAEWLRFAFHDMATHDVSDGSGGLDGSIVYELDRAANFGAGFTSTLSDFQAYPNKYVSRADLIALGAVFGVSTCSGPTIPFRGGRIDAWTAGATGAPEPQQDLQTFKDTFARQGFTPAEMIQLVACGHSMGSVRSTDFPSLVAPNPNSATPVLKYFDNTTRFDNNIITQYLDGTTANPLVVGPNQTLVSDLRVFSSDSNATMRSIADPAAFASTCQSILERMVNVVPHGVSLTDEITLLPVKVSNVQLTFERQKFVFKANFRLTQNLSSTVNKQRTVKMLWCDRYGGSQNCKGATRSSIPASTLPESNLSPLTTVQGCSFLTYNFVVPIDPSVSVLKFWFEVNEHDGKSATIYNNGGNGYAVAQDQILFVPTLSQMSLQSNTGSLHPRGGGAPVSLVKEYFIVAAVRDGSNPSRVYMDAHDFAFTNFTKSLNTTVDLQLNSSLAASQGYSFYTGTVIDDGLQLTIDIHSILSNGTVYTEDFKQTSELDNTPYTAPTDVTNVSSSSSSTSSLKSLDGQLCIFLVLATSLFRTWLL